MLAEGGGDGLADEVYGDDDKGEGQDHQELGEGEAVAGEDLVAEVGQQELNDGDAAHTDQETLVGGDFLEQIETLGPHVEAVEDGGENEESEEGRAQNIIGRMPPTRAEEGLNGPTQEQEQTDADGNGSTQCDGRPHIAADDGVAARFWPFAHIALKGRLSSECQGRQSVYDQVDPQYLHDGQGVGDAEDGGQHVDGHGGHVDGELIDDELANVVIDGAAVENSLADSGEIVVHDDNVARLFGHLGATAHGEAHIRFLQGGTVVDAVARHTDHQIQLLGSGDQAALIRRQSTRDHAQAR